MKILLLAPASSIHTIRWAEAFRGRGHDVTIVSLPNHQLGTDTLSEGIHVHYLPVKGSIGYYLNALALRKYSKKIRPDVINAHFASGYGTLARLSGLHPAVLNVWGSDVYVFPRQGKINRKILQNNIKAADAVASTSRCMADELRSVMGNYREKITITPFGVDIEQFRPFKDSDIRQSDYFTVGTVKALKDIYGIDCIIEAFGLFLQKWKDNKCGTRTPRLLIYGKGEDENKYIEQIEALGLEQFVELKGFISHDLVPEVINSFDVSCYGSRSESFGVSAIESMACEVPVVVTDAEGLAEVTEDGVTGYIVPIDDPQTIADKLWYLYNNEEERVLLGQNGRKRVLQLYNWEDNACTLEKLLKEQCGKEI